MRTVVVGTRPPELDALIARCREQGLDLFDELWNGEYHMNPAPHPRHGAVDHQVAALLFSIAKSKGLFPSDHSTFARCTITGSPTLVTAEPNPTMSLF
jgi:hypothetical protein